MTYSTPLPLGKVCPDQQPCEAGGDPCADGYPCPADRSDEVFAVVCHRLLASGFAGQAVVSVGLGRIVALYCRSSTSYQIHEDNRYLCF